MNVRNTTLLCTVLLVGLTATPLAAQTRGGADAVVELAVEAVFDSLSLSMQPGDTAHIDLSAIPPGVDRGLLAGRLSMGLARQANVVRCPPIEGRPLDKNCFIEGADYLVTIHRVTISGRTASVEAEVQGEHEGDDYRVLWSGGWEVVFVWGGVGWLVTEFRRLWQAN